MDTPPILGVRYPPNRAWSEESVEEQTPSPIEKVLALFKQIEDAIALLVNKATSSAPETEDER